MDNGADITEAVGRAADLIELYQSGLLLKHLVPSLSSWRLVPPLARALELVSASDRSFLLHSFRTGAFGCRRVSDSEDRAFALLLSGWYREGSKYALIAFGTFTPTVVATYGAVDNVDRTLIRMGQSFGLSWWSIVRKIVLPGAMPGILSGLRISLAIAIILLVAAEMLGAEYGIGAYILEAGSLYDLERLFVGVVILSVLGVIVSASVGFAERRILRWRV